MIGEPALPAPLSESPPDALAPADAPAPADAGAGAAPPAPGRRGRLGTIVNLVGLALGVGLLVALIARLDAHEVAVRLRQVGWFFPLAFLSYAMCQVVTAAAWRETILPGESRASYLHLLAVFQVGHAVNAVTPGGTLGDVLRGTLLRGYVRGPALVGSLISHGFFLTAAASLATVVGSGLCLLLLDLPLRVIGTVFGLAVLFLLPLVVVSWLLRRGAAGIIVRLLRRLPFVRLRDPGALLARARAVDENIHALRRDHPDRFRRIVFWLFLSRIFQTGELWLYLVALLPDRSPAWLALLALLTETANQMATWAFTVVPGGVGVVEGNASLLYRLLGLDPVTGLTATLLRRLRMILGIIVGLVVGWLLGLRQSSAPETSDAG